MPVECEGIRFLSYEDLVEINRRLIERQTPTEPVGVLSEGALHSAQARPSTYRYYEQCEDILCLAAVLGEGIAQDHCFRNANKRTAAAAMIIFLLLNGVFIDAPEEELVEIMVDVVNHERTREELEDWLYQYYGPFDSANLNADGSGDAVMIASFGFGIVQG